MSYTTDTANLFQSDAQHEKAAIRAARAELLADRGAPIKLGSKPLSIAVKHRSDAEPEAWVAESGFVVRRVGLETGNTKQIYRGHGGPVTSLDFYTTRSEQKRELLISGSWDKSFRVWDTQTKTLLSTTVGHIDFVKTLVVIPLLGILVTGSSDKDIRIWDLSPLDSLDVPTLATSAATSTSAPSDDASPNVAQPQAPPPQQGAAPPPAVSLRPLPCLLALKAHTRPIEQLAFLPLSHELPAGLSEDEAEAHSREWSGRVALLSADSMGALKVWELWRDEEGTLRGELRCEVRHHELGIHDMLVGPQGELWTASTDNSALLSQLSLTSASVPPTPLLRLPHPAQLRSLLPLSLSPAALTHSLLTGTPPPAFLLTGASDELIRAFDLSLAALDPSPTREAQRAWRGAPLREGSVPEGCVREVEGHTHEVVQLRAYRSRGDGGALWVLSAGLDGTLRRWRWDEMRSEKRDRIVLIPVEGGIGAARGKEDEGDKADKGESLLTEEEERELAELMGDD
ncbi:uncharacterized protein JCM10292_004007 [Rhodotorula paludigena]|uniref:uncharacterized protein n=1 Tax=Rhodotorula paludigena TaxID=86838 RepID=UPI00316E7D73